MKRFFVNTPLLASCCCSLALASSLVLANSLPSAAAADTAAPSPTSAASPTLTTTLTTTANSLHSRPVIVLIIDDMGNSLEQGHRALSLPGQVSYAFLPHTAASKPLAEAAFNNSKEIMLHLPMSNLNSYKTGPGTLTARMDKQEYLQTLQKNIASIPHVSGVNNHMGSLLTQLNQPMSWLMGELRKQQLYFVDSRTSPLTVAEQQANAARIPTIRRDIFLDNVLDSAAIARQYKRLLSLARQNGIAVAIGHPHRETLDFLEQALPELASQGIRLAFASEAIALAQHRAENNSDAKMLLTKKN